MSIALLRQLANLQTHTSRERLAFIEAQPRLLSPSVLRAMQAEIAADPTDDDAKLQDNIVYLDRLRGHFERNLEKYPIGGGPVEKLMRQVIEGTISASHGARLAADEELAAAVSPVYLKALALRSQAGAVQGDWPRAVQAFRLLLALVEVLDEEVFRTARRSVWEEWIELVRRVLVDVPAADLYEEGVAIAERLLAELRAEGNRSYEGEVLKMLGTVHLDPYVANRGADTYEAQHEQWLDRLGAHPSAELVQAPDSKKEMPRPGHALDLARQNLEEAVPLLEGHKRGLALKALHQCEFWRQRLGARLAEGRLARLANQALELLDVEAAPEKALAVLGILVDHGEPLPVELLNEIFSRPLEHHLDRFGVDETVRLYLSGAELLQDQASEQALRLAARVGPVVASEGDEALAILYLEKRLHLLVAAHAVEPTGASASRDEPLMRLVEQATAESWQPLAVGASIVDLALRLEGEAKEAEALRVLDSLPHLAPPFTRSFAPELAFLTAALLLGEAANLADRGHAARSVRSYGEAILRHLAIGLVDRAIVCLQRIEQLVERDDPDLPGALVAALLPNLADLEVRVGEPATRIIQHICKRAVARSQKGPIAVEPVFALLRLAKGFRFSACLGGSTYRPAEDPRAQRLLDRIKRLESKLGPAPPPAETSVDPLWWQELVLMTYAADRAVHSGRDPRERLVNRQHRYDEHVNDAMLAAVPTDDPQELFLAASEIQQGLDERTVVLDYFLGATRDGRLATVILLLASDDIQLVMNADQEPDARVGLEVAGERVLAHPEAVEASLLRREIVGDPEAGNVTRAAAERLERGVERYFGGIREHLLAHRKRGRDHLCIAPHGPLHYLPFHLLGPEKHPLALDWTVTYLPNPGLLGRRARRRSRAARRRHSELTALGMSFTGRMPHGLPEIRQAAAEARAVAEIFGGRSLIDEEVDEGAFIQALKSSRYVHLATHGEHNFRAPSFQTLFLTPGDGDDGRLFAHELLCLDLSGLELVTLSACETALGRFDTGDNLRGLPASLFLAGVPTLVGTLWQVEDHASYTFFTELYGSLKAGNGIREAFKAAQTTTRERHPQHRDWGAFYLAGRWET